MRPATSYQVSHTWLISPTLINEAKVNASWNGQRVPPVGDVWQRETYGFQFPQLFAGGDMARQKQMLLGALVLLRKSLRDLDAVLPTLRKLGARHVGYGAVPAHYPVVGATLIWAMAEVAGHAWERRYSEAWSEAFTVVAGAMLEGAAEAELPAAA